MEEVLSEYGGCVIIAIVGSAILAGLFAAIYLIA